jgi:glycosyltransferase involved in cell wall biosynthesis
MKICMVLMNLESVVHDSRVRKEAGSLVKAGNRVCLVAMRHPGENFGKSMDNFDLELFRLWTRHLPKNTFFRLLKYAEFNMKAFIRMIHYRADVYHAHDLDTLLPTWLSARLTGAKIVYDSHELFTERPIALPGFWRFLERFLITRVDAIIAANDDRAEIMVKEYGANELPTVIMNCPSSANIQVTGNITLREALPPEVRGKRIVLYQGALSPNRCLESLVMAAQYFDERSILVFVGNSSSFSEEVLKALVVRYGMEGRIFFKEKVDSRHLVHYISTADIGVIIYKNSCRNNYLCAPNKMFEYCMAGLPSIGCNFPPIRRIAEKHGVTLLFDPESPESIADSANELLKNTTLFANAKAATSAVAAEFTWEHEENKLLKLYDNLL